MYLVWAGVREMINAKQTVGEIATRQPSTIEMFEQLGIQYCCRGDETLETSCGYLGLPLNGVLSELNRVASAKSTAKAPWADPILETLMGNLLRTRRGLVQQDLPRIQQLAHTVSSCHLREHSNAIHLAYLSATLAHEVTSHFAEEAQTLFPKIRELELAYVGSSSVTVHLDGVRKDLEHMTHEHGEVGDLLSRIEDATENYNATASTCSSYREICEKLKGIDGEIRQEVHLENNVLFDRALQISGALHG
jgi:regulator of cell morphogenesis and NO signaling